MVIYKQVTKQFSPDDFALKDVSFELPSGSMAFITGPSGSGKTTLMRLLIREYSPTSGDVVFDGTSLASIKSSQVHHHRRKIGVVFQDYKLLPDLNVWENIALPLQVMGKPDSEVEQRVSDLLKLIKMPEKAFLFPSQLSGGEAQRISIARALAPAPQVIFADEPTGNLDDENSLAIAKLLRKINELGTTILFATHDLDLTKEYADIRHVVLENGRITKDTHEKHAVEDKIEEKAEDTSNEKKEEEPTKKESDAPADPKAQTQQISIWRHLLNPLLKKKVASVVEKPSSAESKKAEEKEQESQEKKTDEDEKLDAVEVEKKQKTKKTSKKSKK